MPNKSRTNGKLRKISLRCTAGSNKATREFFYQDTNSSHAYVASKNKHLRKTLDKKQAGTVICSSEYDLDAAGNRLGRTDQDGKYDAWSYDPNQQLRAESRWSAKTPGSLVFRTEYGYDGNGNRTVMFEDGVKTAYTIGNNNEMTEAGIADITYDFYGNTYMINDGSLTTEFLYDYERHVTEIYQNETQIAEFEYDGDGRRMRAEYNQSGTWTNFVHCELTGEILAEYTLVSTTFTIKCLNTYGIGLISSNRESTKRYFHFDGLGNTVALTDASENITDTYVYTAFGNIDSSTGSSVNPYRYVGQWGYYDDGAMGCAFDILLLGVRYYIPAYGRFLTWDPVRQVNLYDYTRNSPTRYIDPTGRLRYGQEYVPYDGDDIPRPVDCGTLCWREYIDDLEECGKKCRRNPFSFLICMPICLEEARAEFYGCLACCAISGGDYKNCVDDWQDHVRNNEFPVFEF